VSEVANDGTWVHANAVVHALTCPLCLGLVSACQVRDGNRVVFQCLRCRLRFALTETAIMQAQETIYRATRATPKDPL
jgi:transcription elongation factor Elf1